MVIFPKLYGLSSKGETKVWQIWVEHELIENGGNLQNIPHIITEWGLLDGKKQVTKKPVKNGKNVGKTNATTMTQQAVADAKSKWEKKKDSRYQETIPSGNEKHSYSLPMLAHPYKKRKHNVKWPAGAQPKLDGVRCIAKKVSHSKIQFTSRKGKPFNTLSHLEPSLLKTLAVGEEFDGELYTREITFQQIVAAVKREKSRHKDIEKVKYWIYDEIDEQRTFRERRNKIADAFLDEYNFGPLVRVRTWNVESEESLFALHAEFIKSGFEGTMVRNWNGLYKKDHRSKDLLKYKDFEDAEFTIVGGVEATGKDEGTVIFICKTKSGKLFNVRPRGTHQERSLWLKNINKLINKKLTVIFQDYSDDGVPRFPVGDNKSEPLAVAIRDYE